MRRVTLRKSRSRSKSPVLRGPRNVSSSKEAVNMLDPTALEKMKNADSEKRLFPLKSRSSSGFRAPVRITCTIAGDGSQPTRGRSSIHDRVSFGGVDRRRSEGDREMGMNRAQRRALARSSIHDRISKRDDDGATNYRKRKHSGSDDEDDRKNGSFREDKPVLRLVDPTFVPRSRAFFDHDMRESGTSGRDFGRNRPYDPKYDFSRERRERGGRRGVRTSWDGYGYSDRRDRDRDRENRGRRDREFPPRSKADGVWTHDKFHELEYEEDDGKTENCVVVDGESANRQVEKKVDDEQMDE